MVLDDGGIFDINRESNLGMRELSYIKISPLMPTQLPSSCVVLCVIVLWLMTDEFFIHLPNFVTNSKGEFCKDFM